ncbi:MAG: response regulator transcription factor [Acidobacteriia bacterium]|nr:response regulator transcription factor [Terriglobia bacterium]
MQGATSIGSHIPAAVVYPLGRSVLTRRETEVLHLMAEGITTKAIADRLGVTFKTAACHRGRILQKLGVDSTVSAVRWAIRQGIVQP